MIGERIKKIRTENNMTQKELAEKLFVTAQAVSRWENGETEPSISTITEMSKIFGVTINELLGIEEEKVVENILLKEVLGKLEKRERQIIMLRYFEDRTQSEIGELLNISQVQVSRIEKKVLSKLKTYIS